MSLLNRNKENNGGATTLSRKNVLRGQLTVKDFISLEQEDRFTPMYDLNRGTVWDEHNQRLLVTSILEGMDIPKIYLYVGETDIQKIKSKSLVEIGQEVVSTVLDNEEEIGVMDGLQRTTTILRFSADDLRTLPNLSVDGHDLKRLLYSELPDEYKAKWENFPIDVTFFFGTREEATEYFHRLNSGIPLNTTEYTNAIDNTICNWIREKANIKSLDKGKFKVFVAEGGTDISVLLRDRCGKRMKFDKWLKQCVAYSAMRANCISISDIGKNGLVKISNAPWENLHKVPVLNSDTTFDLSNEVQTIFDWIDDIATCPRKVTKINGGLLVNLYMILRSFLHEGYEVDDPVLFSKKFFAAHQDLEGITPKESNAYHLDTRRGIAAKELQNRLKCLTDKLLANSPFGITQRKA